MVGFLQAGSSGQGKSCRPCASGYSVVPTVSSLLKGAPPRAGSFGGSLLDLVFPPSCLRCGAHPGAGARHPLCRDCKQAMPLEALSLCAGCGRVPSAGPLSFCTACRAKLHRDGLLSLGPFEGPLRDLLHAFKYGADLRAGAFLAGLLALRVYRELPGAFDAVVPVPLHPRRLRARGFNQSALLARRISRISGAGFIPKGLERRIDTRPLAGLDQEERRRQMKNAVALRHRVAMDGRKVLLVDDVVTSGATVEECCRVLKKGGASRTIVASVARA